MFPELFRDRMGRSRSRRDRHQELMGVDALSGPCRRRDLYNRNAVANLVLLVVGDALGV